jgi:hypothetical protein
MNSLDGDTLGTKKNEKKILLPHPTPNLQGKKSKAT